jgi:hypothetical protein
MSTRAPVRAGGLRARHHPLPPQAAHRRHLALLRGGAPRRLGLGVYHAWRGHRARMLHIHVASVWRGHRARMLHIHVASVWRGHRARVHRVYVASVWAARGWPRSRTRATLTPRQQAQGVDHSTCTAAAVTATAAAADAVVASWVAGTFVDDPVTAAEGAGSQRPGAERNKKKQEIGAPAEASPSMGRSPKP